MEGHTILAPTVPDPSTPPAEPVPVPVPVLDIGRAYTAKDTAAILGISESVLNRAGSARACLLRFSPPATAAIPATCWPVLMGWPVSEDPRDYLPGVQGNDAGGPRPQSRRRRRGWPGGRPLPTEWEGRVGGISCARSAFWVSPCLISRRAAPSALDCRPWSALRGLSCWLGVGRAQNFSQRPTIFARSGAWF